MMIASLLHQMATEVDQLPIRATGMVPINKTAAIRATGRALIAVAMAVPMKANIRAHLSAMVILHRLEQPIPALADSG